MNKKTNRINQCMKLLDNSFRHDFNSVRINTHNTKKHELAKCSKVYDLIASGKTILTEATFKNKSRADILVLNDFEVVEILHSETETEVLNKTEYYPFELNITYFTTTEIMNEIIGE